MTAHEVWRWENRRREGPLVGPLWQFVGAMLGPTFRNRLAWLCEPPDQGLPVGPDWATGANPLQLRRYWVTRRDAPALERAGFRCRRILAGRAVWSPTQCTFSERIAAAPGDPWEA